MLVDLFAHYEELLRAEITAAGRDGVFSAGLDANRITVEQPRDPSHGDLATNAAMVLAKDSGLKPREFAERLASRLEGCHRIKTAEVAGPGFVNMRLEDAVWHDVLRAVLDLKDAYGAANIGHGVRVNVEYVSANPTGPMHVGHCRGAVVGDALANLLAFTGHAVTREYYINDAGAQIDTLARSVFLRYREALGETIGEIPTGLYPGEYLKPVGERLAADHGETLRGMEESEWLAIVRDAAIDSMMAEIRNDLALLSIRHDVFFSERSLVAEGDDRIAAALEALRDRGLIYQGRLPPPKGQPPEDWEDREQMLFKSTEFGDDVDRPLIKSDGSYTYFASDIAYHFDKFSRGFARMIDVWGADHGGYVKRMKAAVTAISGGEGDLDVKLCQLVRLLRAGEPVKMSKRAGDFITLRTVVDEVGSDPIRFMMLYRKNDAPLDFDFARVTERSRDNPVFYVQYAHARARSVLRNAREMCPKSATDAVELAAAPLDILVDPAEVEVLRRLAQFPRMVDGSARAHEPHRVAYYLYELASDFHALWNRGKELPHLRFIQHNDVDNTNARLALVRAVAQILQAGLGVLGVNAPEEME